MNFQKICFYQELHDICTLQSSSHCCCRCWREQTIKTGYEIDKIAPYLDFINLMTYDFHGGSWENVTGLHTGLFARSTDTGDLINWNQVNNQHLTRLKIRLMNVSVGLGCTTLDRRHASRESDDGFGHLWSNIHISRSKSNRCRCTR